MVQNVFFIPFQNTNISVFLEKKIILYTSLNVTAQLKIWHVQVTKVLALLQHLI